MFLRSLLVLSSLVTVALSVPTLPIDPSLIPSLGGTSCFPALGFNMPSGVPDSLDGWWCDMADEYAFVGFSYEITACNSAPRSSLGWEFIS
jgi:hypothetical protein